MAALLASVSHPREPARLALQFHTAKEITLAAPEATPYVCEPHLVKGSKIKLDAPPKLGKTTWRNYQIRCVLLGESCLGYPSPSAAPVVLCTEEPLAACVEGLRASGLDQCRDLHILTSFDARAHKWPEIVAAAVDRARTVGATVLVLDTPGPFVGLDGDSENFVGTALAVMAPLDKATAAGLAVLIPWHDRKSGGEVGESGPRVQCLRRRRGYDPGTSQAQGQSGHSSDDSGRQPVSGHPT